MYGRRKQPAQCKEQERTPNRPSGCDHQKRDYVPRQPAATIAAGPPENVQRPPCRWSTVPWRAARLALPAVREAPRNTSGDDGVPHFRVFGAASGRSTELGFEGEDINQSRADLRARRLGDAGRPPHRRGQGDGGPASRPRRPDRRTQRPLISPRWHGWPGAPGDPDAGPSAACAASGMPRPEDAHRATRRAPPSASRHSPPHRTNDHEPRRTATTANARSSLSPVTSTLPTLPSPCR